MGWPAKLNVKAVESIIAMLNNNISPAAIAASFGVNAMTIYRIRSGAIWTSVIRDTTLGQPVARKAFSWQEGGHCFSQEELDGLIQNARVEIRAIPGYPDYLASSDGHIWHIANRKYHDIPLVVHELPNASGYWRVRVTCAGKQKRLLVHRLVALAFHGTPEPYQEVRHINSDHLDNRASNLAWGTRGENMLDAKIFGRTARGSRNGQSKLSEEDVREVWNMATVGVPRGGIAKAMRVSIGTVSNILNGKSWTHVCRMVKG
jgi:hypothetical protein